MIEEIRELFQNFIAPQLEAIKGDIKAPEVVASVIYADEIKAHSVIADNIYVKNLRRR